MNWPLCEKGADPQEADMPTIVDRMIDAGKLQIPDWRNPGAAMRRLNAAAKHFSLLAHAATVMHDTAPAFERHLAAQWLEHALVRNELARRTDHKIVPHRLGASLGSGPSALPKFKDTESWYLRANVASPTWTERYIEIIPV